MLSDNRMEATQKPLFLLGGHDLEMLEIKNILAAAGAEYLDRNLGWGAALSAYADVLENPTYAGRPILGIELTEDVVPPPQYVRIDHHNDFVDRPAAVLQVLDYLGIAPTRWHQLVGANDSGFIPGMLAIGATQEEVAAVRAADRKAQGLTEEDERLALESIAENLRVESGVTIVAAKPGLRYFSPITDHLYGKAARLLCHTDRKLTYYWEGAGHLGREFEEEVGRGVAYQGGGEAGYFGIDEKQTEAPISVWIDRILETLEDVH